MAVPNALEKKSRVVLAFIEEVRREREILTQALHSAVEAATHSENKAEDAHDTRATEASYLSAGQSKRAIELDYLMTQLELLARNLNALTTIQVGAWITLQSHGKQTHYLFLNAGGGVSVQIDGVTTQILTPQSALGDELRGLKAGDAVEIEVQEQSREYEIVSLI